MKLASLRLLRFVVPLVFLLAWVNDAAEAQSVPVRTGEHPTFTRIVIDFVRRPGWQLGRHQGRYEFWLDDPAVRFDLNDAFRRLQARRVADLKDLGNGKLAIEVSCDCSLSVEQLPNQGLLIDVRDERPAPDDQWAKTLVPPRSSLEPAPRPASRAILPVVLPDSAQRPPFGPLVEGTTDLLNSAARARIDELRIGLTEQAGRAATQGLIVLETPDREGQAVAESGALKRPAAAPPPMAANIRIETQYDRDTRASNSGPVREQKFACIPADLVDIGGWFEEGAVLDKLGAARTDLLDARDRPDPLAYRTFARMLIYLTFGREAREVIQQSPEQMPDRDVLLELATLVDDGAATDLSILPTQTNCDTVGALWGLLAQAEPIAPDLLNTEAVLRHLSAFPDHLRQHLGPRIAEKLMDLGQQEAALQIRNSIERGGPSDGPAILMLQARLDQADGNQTAANANLKAVAGSRSEQAVQALTQLIQNQVREGQQVPDEMLQQAMAMVFEFEVDSRIAKLPTAIIAAMAQESKFAEAFEQISQFAVDGQLDVESAAAAMLEVQLALADEPDDVTFLTTAVMAAHSNPIEDPARLLIARRLVGLGLTTPARAALGSRADIPSEEERYILAEIAILEGKRSVATSYLTGLVSEQANQLRDQAEGILSTEAVSRLPETVGDGLTDPADVTPTITEGALAQNRELLNETRAMRDSLLSLLREGSN